MSVPHKLREVNQTITVILIFCYFCSILVVILIASITTRITTRIAITITMRITVGITIKYE
jgi:hypothetical protein